MWGLFDTKDGLWLGNDSGPKTFDDHLLARCAAQIVETQMLGTDLGCRIQAREIQIVNPRIVDKVCLKMSGLKALQRIEGDEDSTGFGTDMEGR